MLWPICHSEYRPEKIWPICHSEYRPEKVWPMCSLDIALSMNDYIIFDKCYCTKNRGACVEAIICLMGILVGQINLNDGKTQSYRNLRLRRSYYRKHRRQSELPLTRARRWSELPLTRARRRSELPLTRARR